MRKSSPILALIAVLALASCGGGGPTAPGGPGTQPPPPPPPPPPVPALRVTTFLAFGDSITEGTTSVSLPTFALTAGIPVSYPFKLQDLLRARYTNQTVNVYNGGQAREKAADGADRLEAWLDNAKPQVLLLMEGANDLSGIHEDTMTELQIETLVDTTVNWMENMVRRADREGVKVMLATLPPEREESPKGKRGAPWVERYNRELKQMAAKKGAMVVDVHAKFPLELIGEDGLHPTDAGYDRMAEIFRDAIRKAFEVPPPDSMAPGP